MASARSAFLVTAFSVFAVAFVLAGCGDSRDGQGEAVGDGTSSLDTPDLFSNDKVAFDYFVLKGLKNFQAAGIVGNLDQESGASPIAVQGGGPGRGVAQWSAGGRWDHDGGDNAVAYANAQGASVWSLNLQLDFIWYELNTFSGYGLAKLKATTTVADATVVFQTDFEGCGTCIQSQRIAYADAVLKAYGATPAYSAQFVGQSFPLATTSMSMVEGQVVPSYIELKNVGTKTWDSNTRLATTQPRDRKSVFADSGWVTSARPAAVTGTVPPGGTFKFAFNLVAPATAGSHDEFFGVVQEGVAWFSDPGQGGPADDQLEVKVVVGAPDYRATLKAQSLPVDPAAITVHEGDVVSGTFDLTNTGTKTWKAGATLLAPTPRDAPSPYADKSWPSLTRISTVAADVPPGAVGRFAITLDANTVGDAEVELGLVEEAVTWFPDTWKLHLVVVAHGTSLEAGAPIGSDGGVGSPLGGGGAIAQDDGGAFVSPDNGGAGSGGGGCTTAGSLPAERSPASWGSTLGLVFVARRLSQRRAKKNAR